jgi:anti-sigma factor RsiW
VTVTPPSAAAAHALTEAGCCARHWWAADGAAVYFIDDPPGGLPLGIYAVGPQGERVTLATTSIVGEGLPPGDAPPQIEPSIDPGFRLPADADNMELSPDGASVAWTAGSELPVNVDRRQRSLWVVAAPLEARRHLAVLTGGDLVGWTADGEAVVATGRLAGDGPAGIWRVPIDGRPPTMLAAADRPRGLRLSPSGSWLAYYLAFQSDAARNGLRVVGTSGEPEREVPAFGSYRWGQTGRLYLIPFDPETESLSLIAFDPASGATEILSDGEAFPGGIAANDWSVSPDERWIVYRSVHDGALWSFPLRRE